MIKKTAVLIIALLFSFLVNDYSIDFDSRSVHLSQKDEKEIECLATNLYKEARGEPLEGIMAVAFVTINRTKSKLFPSSVCEVVYQRTPLVCQFSWVCDKIHFKKMNNEVYNKIKRIATFVYLYSDKIEDVSKGALFFHADYVNPLWKNKMIMTTKIGRHIFYKI